MFLPGLDRETRDIDIKELDRAVSTCADQLILIRFRPGEIVKGILGVETSAVSENAIETRQKNLPAFLEQALGSHANYIQSAIADETKVGTVQLSAPPTRSILSIAYLAATAIFESKNGLYLTA